MTASKWYTRRDIVVITLIAIVIAQAVITNTYVYDKGHEAGYEAGFESKEALEAGSAAAYDEGWEDREAFESTKWTRFTNMVNNEQAVYERTIESLERQLAEAMQE